MTLPQNTKTFKVQFVTVYKLLKSFSLWNTTQIYHKKTPSQRPPLMWNGKMQPIVVTVEEFNNHTRDVNAELNLRFRLQSIFFRLSIFNEVISFSIKHISVRQSNFPLVYIFRCVCCFFFHSRSLSLYFVDIQFDFRLRIVESKSNYLSVWLSWFYSSARDFRCYISTLFPHFIFHTNPIFFILFWNQLENEDLIKIMVVRNRCILDYTNASLDTFRQLQWKPSTTKWFHSPWISSETFCYFVIPSSDLTTSYTHDFS